jgi:hypothetical protein
MMNKKCDKLNASDINEHCDTPPAPVAGVLSERSNQNVEQATCADNSAKILSETSSGMQQE